VVAVNDPALLMPAFALADPRVLVDLLTSRAAALAPDIWRYFFHGSLVHLGHVAAPVSRVGFYNPHADGWVMTDWRWDGGVPSLVRVEVATGEAMRAERLETAWPTAWGRSGRAPTAFRDMVALGAVAFAKAHPLAAPAGPAANGTPDERRAQQATVELRLLAGLRNLVQHGETPGFATTTEALLAAVRAGDAAALGKVVNGSGAQAIHQVAGLPTYLRGRLELTGLYPTGNGAIATFGAPLMPRWVVMGLYRNGAKNGVAAVEGLAVVDLTPTSDAGS
jgi:hypothetical protein